ATAETCADAVEKRAVRYLYESSYCIYTIRHRTNQAGSANAKIGVYCGRANERSKTAISLGMEWLVAVNLPKRLADTADTADTGRHRSPMSESQQQAQEAVSARSQRAANFWQPFYVIRLNSVLWLCRWRWCGGLRRGRWLGCRWLGCCPSGIGLIVQLNDFIGHVDVC